MLGRIFISYRRNDSQYATDRIYERLAAHFGVDGVFMDIDDIPMGVNFRDYIDQQIGTSDIVLAVIGDHWLNARDEEGSLRLQNPNDFVRLEIEAALNQEIRLVPVFIGGVESLPEKALPDSLKPLNLINATKIRRSRDFLPDVDKLIKGIEKIHTQQERTRKKNRDRLASLTTRLTTISEQTRQIGMLTRNEQMELTELTGNIHTLSSDLNAVISNEEVQLRVKLKPYETQTNKVLTQWDEFNRKLNQRLAAEEANRSQKEREEQKKRNANLMAIQSLGRSIQDTQNEIAEVSDLTIEERRLQVRLNREIQFALRSLSRIKESPSRLLVVDLDEHEEKVDQIQSEWLELITAIDTRKLDELEKQKQQEKDQDALQQLNQAKLKHEREQRERVRKQQIDDKTEHISGLTKRFNACQRQLTDIFDLTNPEKRTRTKLKKIIQQKLQKIQQVMDSPDSILQFDLKEFEAQYDQLILEIEEFSNAVRTRKANDKSIRDAKQAEKVKSSTSKEKPRIEPIEQIAPAKDRTLQKKEKTQSNEAKLSRSKTIFQNKLTWIIIGSVLVIGLFFGGYQLISNMNKPIESMPTPIPKSYEAGTHYIRVKDNALMVFVPEGEYIMGDYGGGSDSPPHEVYLSGYWIDKYEVSEANYLECVADDVCEMPGYLNEHEKEYPDANDDFQFPVRHINSPMASTYCEWAGGRLPTEAEWEKATRGTDDRVYPWGNDEPTCDLANFDINLPCDFPEEFEDRQTRPINWYPDGASELGVFNLAGNVREWVSDVYDENYYFDSPESNPTGPEGSNPWQSVRGGSFYSDSSKLQGFNRDFFYVTSRAEDIGFRCAADAGAAENTAVMIAYLDDFTQQATRTPETTPTQTATPSPTPTATFAPTAEPFGIKTNLKDNAPMVLIPAGEFLMGSEEFENTQPIHYVYTDEFWMYKYEVTNEMFAAFLRDVNAENSDFYQERSDEPITPIKLFSEEWKAAGGYEDHPAGVNWVAASLYCEWAGGRLPTEPEWEKAARGGLEGMRYPWGNEDPVNDFNVVNGANIINFSTTGSLVSTKPVGLYYPNGYGLYNMGDNAREWVSSADYEYPYEFYKAEQTQNLWGDFRNNTTWRIQRGGGLAMGNVAYRYATRGDKHHYPSDMDGFRCVYPADPSSAVYIDKPVVTPTPAVEIGETKIREKDEMDMVYVPAGTFLMGVDAEDNPPNSPTHEVYLDAYWVDKYEVSNAQYEGCVSDGVCQETDDNPYNSPEFADFPRTFVDWSQAKAYCEWAGGSLPTEAQWEKAARGTDERMYPWGNEEPTCDHAVFGGEEGFCEHDEMDRVGSSPSGQSPYGAVDMAGNVWEWVLDWYAEDYYSNSPRENPTGPTSGEYRVIRGGGWSNSVFFLRTTFRNSDDPNYSEHTNGFRCVVNVEP